MIGDYARTSADGKSTKGRPRRSLDERFWECVECRDVEKCWPWMGSIHHDGYGVISAQIARGQMRQFRAHCVSYVIHNGEIPPGFIVRHTCDNRRCVNPAHLLAGTYQDNSNDMKSRGRQKKGIHAANAVLDDALVMEIREKYATGTYTMRRLGAEYGITGVNVRYIVTGYTWKHLPVLSTKAFVEETTKKLTQKLNYAMAQEIRALRGKRTLKVIAEMYGIGGSTLWRILLGQTWTRPDKEE